MARILPVIKRITTITAGDTDQTVDIGTDAQAQQDGFDGSLIFYPDFQIEFIDRNTFYAAGTFPLGNDDQKFYNSDVTITGEPFFYVGKDTQTQQDGFTGSLIFYPDLGNMRHIDRNTFYAVGTFPLGNDDQRFYNSDVDIDGSASDNLGNDNQRFYNSDVDISGTFTEDLGNHKHGFYMLSIFAHGQGLPQRGADESPVAQTPSSGWINIENALIESAANNEAESEATAGLTPVTFDHRFYLDLFYVNANPGDGWVLTKATVQWRSRWDLQGALLETSEDLHFTAILEERDGTDIVELDDEDGGATQGANTQATLVVKTRDITSDIAGLSNDDRERLRIKFLHRTGDQLAPPAQLGSNETSTAHVDWAKIFFYFERSQPIG